jgi:RNA polymerase-interacting CarD/CdnL/TRCF family regulator
VKVLIPIAQAEASGLRRPISKQEAEQVLRVLHMPATPLEPRSREELGEVSARLASNDSLQIAKTIRDLAAAGVKKWLSRSDVTLVDTRHGEQATLISALERLTEELAYAQHASRKDVEEYVRKCLGRARKRPKAHVIQN